MHLQPDDTVATLLSSLAGDGAATVHLLLRVAIVACDAEGTYATSDYRYNELLFIQVSQATAATR